MLLQNGRIEKIRIKNKKWTEGGNMVFNNPEVPGLVYKLAPMDEKIRKLPHVRKLWEGIFDVCEVKDVFTGKPVNTKQYDIDHFIPWSFVMNDELWNLMPMDSSLNSSKKGFLSGNLSLKYLRAISLFCMKRYMKCLSYINFLKPATEITFILYGP
jgi:hypothetical protein